MFKPLCGILLWTILASNVHAGIETLTLNSQEALPAPRWMFGSGEPPKGPGLHVQLAALKQAQLAGENSSCLEKAHAVRNKAKSLQAWIALVEIDCATKALSDTASADRLAQALESVERNPQWLLTGSQVGVLRPQVIKSYLLLIEQDVKTNRSRAWRSVERAQGLLAFMDDKSRAKLWQLAGEAAFVMQKPIGAREFFRRSYREFETEDVRSRLATIEAAIAAVENSLNPGQKNANRSEKPVPPAADAALESSSEELALVERITTALKAGDLIAAVQDGTKLVYEFPGGTRAKWATDRIWEAYVSVADRNDAKYGALRESMVRAMEKVDADRLAEWARLMYNRGQYEDSLALVKKSLESLSGAKSTKVLELASEAAVATDQLDVALEYLNTLIDRHAGTPSSRQALLRAGLIHYRKGRHAQAVALFERLLVLPQIDNMELIARHWLWRSLQKLKLERADRVADELMQRYPFSYYGLRARLERNQNKIDLQLLTKSPDGGKLAKVESQLWLTGPEKLAWEKAQLLMKSGWLDEAQAELRELPVPLRAEDKAIRALLWAAVGQYVNASRLANEAWDEKPELRRPPFTTSAFPQDFASDIATEAATRKLDRYLIKGLIKQESGYLVRATSPSNALGLMQIIPPTAKEISSDLKMGALTIPDDLFVPKKNIQMGTYYISRLITKYQGYVPLALAAYNAGPARMDRWLRARPSLKNLPGLRSSAPEDELWMDEIPYAETSFYVKAILRNLLLYRLLDQGRVEVSDPVWSFDGSL